MPAILAGSPWGHIYKDLTDYFMQLPLILLIFSEQVRWTNGQDLKYHKSQVTANVKPIYLTIMLTQFNLKLSLYILIHYQSKHGS